MHLTSHISHSNGYAPYIAYYRSNRFYQRFRKLKPKPKLNPPNAHRSQIKICENRQTQNVQFRFMPNAFRIIKPIQKSSKRVWVFRNTGANAFAKNQMRLAYEDKRDLYCICIQGESKKKSPLTKCDTITPNLEINKIRFRHSDHDVHADMWYRNGIDRSRNAWAMSAWKRRTTFAPTQGLHIGGYVPSRHRYCNSHISSYEWKIWIITKRQSQATEMQTLCWRKTRPSFSGADNSYISWPTNTTFVPRIGMYIRINIPEMDVIYLKIWCNSVIFCQRGIFFDSPCSYAEGL